MADDSLAAFEIPPVLVAPALSLSRGFNTALDMAFYDVPTLMADLKARGETVETARANAPPAALDLDALVNPEGALLVVDPARAPYLTRFDNVPTFLAWYAAAEAPPRIASITGVGSSALGSAAFAWDIAKARNAPVIAIVPGFGVADALTQALGGFFGFGLQNALGAKSAIQKTLAMFAPELAWMGRGLVASAPGSAHASSGAPVFVTGSGSSDVLHSLMGQIELGLVVGHSKGALSIANALRSLDPSRTAGLKFITLGCPVAEEIDGVTYHQALGLFDAIGQLNSWGNPPETWLPADHSTNRALPLSMDAGALAAG